jgi:hypothetical protein
MKIKHVNIKHYAKWIDWILKETKNQNFRWGYNQINRCYTVNKSFYHNSDFSDYINITLPFIALNRYWINIEIIFNNINYNFYILNIGYNISQVDMINTIKDNINHQDYVFNLRQKIKRPDNFIQTGLAL